MNDTTNTIMLVMAIGSFIQPMFFGAIFLFMFKWFPTRKEVELQEANQQARHLENQTRFTTIETDIKTLINR